MHDHLFKPGENPTTGERAIRSQVYEVITTFPQQSLTAIDIQGLMPEFKLSAVNAALRGLIHNPTNYPHMHRVGRGEYMYDPTRSTIWATFPQMARRRKVNGKIVPVNRLNQKPGKTVKPRLVMPTPNVAPVQQAPVQQAPVVPVQQAQTVLTVQVAGVSKFVDMMPVFTNEGPVSMDKQVLLRDTDGNFWHASRI